MKKKKIVVFSGAGMSADSGISTFRDNDGLWARYDVEEVCTPRALARNRPLVIEFYNMRRRELLDKHPNAGHRAILSLARTFDVEVVTQNIDDLHERAALEEGFPLKVTHLHGELRKLRSSRDENAVVELQGWEQTLDATHPDGSLLRPFVVFFGEAVPMMDTAARIVSGADILIVVGTSLAVYPAASLIDYARSGATVYLIDPKTPQTVLGRKVVHIPASAAEGLPRLVKELKR